MKVCLFFTVSIILLACAGLCFGGSRLPNSVISGIVYVDSDCNGIRSAGERGLPGVGVSDGSSVVVTDREGRYSITSGERILYVSVPSGFRSRGPFFFHISSEECPEQVDFPLVPSKKSADFSFVQITDVHIDGDVSSYEEVLDDIAALAPDFIVSTGDMVEDGKKTSDFETYADASERVGIPIFDVMGNHDKPLENYERCLGPSHYSFDFGKCHFVVFNSIDADEQQDLWLQKDLSLLARGSHVIVFSHYMPTKSQIDLFSRYDLIAWFSGHRHSDRYIRRGRVRDYNAAAPCFGNFDLTPREFKLVKVRDGKQDVSDRYIGIDGTLRYLTIVSPGDGCRVGPGRVRIQASAYDTRSTEINPEYSIDGSPWRGMKKAPGWNWTADVSLSQGRHSLRVRAGFGGIEKESEFEVDGESPALPVVGRDWPMFKCSAARMGLAADKVSPPLHLAWSRPLGGLANISSPVTAERLVFIALADNEGRDREGVYALDAVTGEIKWRFDTKTSVKNSVTYDKGLVYACDSDSNVYALDAGTGKPVWETEINPDYKKWYCCSPVADGGSLYLGRSFKFVSLDERTGEFVWKADRMGDESNVSVSSPALGDGAVFIGYNRGGGLFALSREDGSLLWNREFRWFIATPAYLWGRVYMAADSSICALDASTGEQVWEYKLPSIALSSPAVSGSRIFVGAGHDKMLAINTADGKEVWSFQAGRSRIGLVPYDRKDGAVVSSPAVSGDTVYFGGADGVFYALNAETGERVWSCDLGAPITASPAVSGNAVFITTIDGTVYAFTEDKRLE